MTIHVLVMESEPELTAALQAALVRERAAVAVVHSCEAAIDRLRVGPAPQLIIVSLDVADGPALLTALKRDADLRSLPVIVVTRAADTERVQEAWDRLANCVIRLPDAAEDISRVAAALSSFWLRLVMLPHFRHARAARP
jgi:DNA-binding response OmpR family regulator